MTLLRPDGEARVEEWTPHTWEVKLGDGELLLEFRSPIPRAEGRIVRLRMDAEECTHLAVVLLQGSSGLPGIQQG